MESVWLDIKYAQFIKNTLEHCRDRSDSKFRINFRCIYCGDSLKSKYKTRGWIYEHDNSLHYKCFNCGVTPSFSKVLEKQAPSLYRDYIVEKFKKEKSPVVFRPTKPVFNIKPSFKLNNIISIDKLDDNHPAKVYVTKRLIPKERHADIWYTDKFFSWINDNIIPEKYPNIKHDEARIVFPLRRTDKSIFGLQGRIIQGGGMRYLTFRHELSDDPKIFGLELLSPKEEIFVVEGPIDSMFLPNCIAMVGAEANLDKMVNKEFTTIIFDNEPRNPEIISRMDKYILQGWKICFWPSTFKFKDINDSIIGGMTPSDVSSIVRSNSYSGLAAQLQMKFWSKS